VGSACKNEQPLRASRSDAICCNLTHIVLCEQYENIGGLPMSDRSKKLGPRVTVSVTPGDYATLSTLAEKHEVSVSWVVRRAIHEYLRWHQQPTRAVRRPIPEKRAAAPERT